MAADDLNKWIVAMRLESFNPTKSSKICSNYFKQESYIVCGWSSKKQLKKDAIPGIFDFPSSLMKLVKPRKPPANRKTTCENIETINDAASFSSTSETASLDRDESLELNVS
ncbi:THAP domain-containing protein 1-like [Hydra vulgaris]|uniref:THAP domain-containing protein 1-like n=1 Tax=Hydra vulgaris TaxID=6087 RepID=UPI0006414D48|nr:THAP domain-containing protein 1-like [Hydra vulgaris]